MCPKLRAGCARQRKARQATISWGGWQLPPGQHASLPNKNNVPKAWLGHSRPCWPPHQIHALEHAAKHHVAPVEPTGPGDRAGQGRARKAWGTGPGHTCQLEIVIICFHGYWGQSAGHAHPWPRVLHCRGCACAHQGVSTVVTKNWLPLVLGPAGAEAACRARDSALNRWLRACCACTAASCEYFAGSPEAPYPSLSTDAQTLGALVLATSTAE